jgi:transcriptional regulator with XRE-family HTH domain
LAISENRKAYIDELRRRSFFKDTQPASEVLRRRIREHREAKGLSQRALAEAMTDVGLPLTFDRISKIEKGVRRVSYDELLGFAFVLGVPLARLMRPPDGEPPIRAGGIGLEQDEVANWLVWGPPTSRDAMGAQTLMRLTLEIQTMMQVAEDERDPAKRTEHRRTTVALVEELWRGSGIRPGVMARQALREAMAQPLNE